MNAKIDQNAINMVSEMMKNMPQFEGLMNQVNNSKLIIEGYEFLHVIPQAELRSIADVKKNKVIFIKTSLMNYEIPYNEFTTSSGKDSFIKAIKSIMLKNTSEDKKFILHV